MDAKWTEGIAHELEFWKGWLNTRGDKWPQEYLDRLNPQFPIQNYLLDYLRPLMPPGSNVNILDVGAGPLTMLGKVHSDYAISIRASDALADYYNALLKQCQVSPPVITEKAFVENLTDVYRPDHFDLVHINNALDHSSDPLKGILQMLMVVKTGHYVIINSFVNEGKKAEYIGLHQWNFDVEGGELVIGNKNGQKLFVQKALTGLAEVRIASHIENDWVSVTLRKVASPETDLGNITALAISAGNA